MQSIRNVAVFRIFIKFSLYQLEQFELHSNIGNFSLLYVIDFAHCLQSSFFRMKTFIEINKKANE